MDLYALRREWLRTYWEYRIVWRDSGCGERGEPYKVWAARYAERVAHANLESAKRMTE